MTTTTTIPETPAHRPAVIWFTGLSGAGKSTIAQLVVAALQQRGTPVEYLDGDRVRELFPTGFSKEDRDAHIARIGFIAHLLEKHGVTVVASFISPYRAARDRVRNLCSRFLEIYVATPLEVCEQRDVKGLYQRARAGHIAHFTGISDPYEPPLHPELTIDTTQLSPTQARDLVLNLYDAA
ncbi:MAG: adenylyl-sulfate kinase [bacterium]|nr:adenylyl-sulfate kinase [bacterium]